MNKLFILGNGFDLAHQLPTSYEHFIVDHLKQALHSANDGNDRVYKDELIYIETYRYRFRPEQIDACNTIEDFHNYVKQYKEYIHVEYKNHFFKQLISIEEGLKLWYDIEKFYYKELIRIAAVGATAVGIQEVLELNKTLDLIKNKLELYLTEKIRIPSKVGNIHSTRFYDIFSQHGDNQKLILNFNYTDTIKLYLPFLGNNTRVINLHGQLNNDDNPLVLGYGDNRDRNYRDIQELDHPEYLKFIKHFSYNLSGNQADLIAFLSSGAFTVEIIGHSCGLSDRTIFHRIFQHQMFQGLKIYYYQTKDNFSLLNKSLDRHFDDPNRWADLVQPFDEKLKCPQFDLTSVLQTTKN
ncbi:MAG: AbiH family protein [Cyclobacteriaceae bacterium]